MLTTHVADARQFLRKTLTGPIQFTPTDRAYRFAGQLSLGAFLTVTVGLPINVVPVRGFAPLRNADFIGSFDFHGAVWLASPQSHVMLTVSSRPSGVHKAILPHRTGTEEKPSNPCSITLPSDVGWRSCWQS